MSTSAPHDPPPRSRFAPKRSPTTARVVRAWRRLDAGLRFVSMTPAEPPRGAAGTQPRAVEVRVHDPGSRVTLELSWTSSVRGRGRARAPGVEPAMTVEEFERVEAAVRAAPAFVDALRRRGIADPSTVDVDPAARGRLRHAGGAGGRRWRACSPMCARRRAAMRTRARSRACSASSTCTRRARPLRGSRSRRAAGGRRRVPRRPRGAARRRAPDPRRPSPRARASRSTATRSAGRSGGCASASAPARASSSTTSRYDDDGEVRRVLDRASYAEMVVPVRRPRPLLPDPARHRRVQHRHDDELADARLRLPRRHPLLRRRVLRRRRRAGRRAQRDLPPRGGRRDALEAHATSAPATSSSGAAGGSSCRASSPSATTTTASTGTCTRTARSPRR